MTGGCFCGFVRYRADGAPFDETNCHCTICRRTSGAPFVAWFSVARADFAFIAGARAVSIVGPRRAHVLPTLRHAVDLHVDAQP